MIEKIYDLYLKNRNVTTDSRNITEGAIYFALKGEHFDGNTFAGKALEGGASYCIIDNPQYRVNDKCILVDDVLTTLQALATFHRKKLNIPCIGITGTNGKTTTKELIYAVLSKKYICHATQGNLNNHIGVPLTLLAIPENAEIALIEMGANHPGEIDFLCKIAQPEYGIITNIGKAHLEGFGSFDGVINTKTELYRYVKDIHGKLFVNADNDLLMEKSQNIPAITYGSHAKADYMATFKRATPYLEFYFEEKDLVYTVKTRIFGSYNFENAVAALCIGKYFRVPDFDIKEAFESYESKNNRSQFIQTKNNDVYLDAYNANPSSMKAAIENFRNMETQWGKIAILGSMKELGSASEKEHHTVFDFIVSGKFVSVFLIGEEFAFTKDMPLVIWFKDTNEAQVYFEKQKIRQASILIKGSRSNHLESLLEVL